MTSIELLAIIQEQKKGWNLDGERGILPHFNAAHFILAANESEQNVYYDESTGDLPALTTVGETLAYDCDSNLWKLGGIYVRIEEISSISGTLVSLSGFDYGSRRFIRRPTEYMSVSGIDYIRVPYVRSQIATESAAVRVVFTADPGSATNYYKQYGWKKPTAIISENIQVDIPPPWDYEYLIPATCKLIEGIEHGNYVEARQYISSVLKPALIKEMNSGEQGFDYEAESRGF